MSLHPVERLSRHHRIAMPFKAWERFPRVQGYKNEYWDGEAHYTPRHRSTDCYLDLRRWSAPPAPTPERIAHATPVVVHRLEDADWPQLAPLLCGAFADHPPICDWGDRAALRAARCILAWARAGRDGLLVRDACFCARTNDFAGHGPLDELCGCALVTLVPVHRLSGAPDDAARPHPEDPSQLVVPHLNWIFVSRLLWRHGIGTLLLGESVAALRRLDFPWLASTCLLSNGASLVWHWRNGFRLPHDDDRFRPAVKVVQPQ